MKHTRTLLLVSAAIAGAVTMVSSAHAQTTTVAAFFDISQGANNVAVFQRNGNLFTGGYSGTGLTLRTPGIAAVPDYTDVTFSVTPLTIVGPGFFGDDTSPGSISFFDNASNLLLKMDFGRAHLSPFGLSAADFFFDNVTFTGGIIYSAGIGAANEQFGFTFANVNFPNPGDPTVYTATASFTSSALIIVPAPASAALLGLGGLVAARRRR